MKKLIIELPDKDHSILERIARDQKRRLNDLSCLLLARGLESFFCETSVSIKKTPDEYTKEETEQLAKNAELEKTEGWIQLPYEKQKEMGWKCVSEWITNHIHVNGKWVDPLVEPLAERIENYAIDGAKDA